MDFFAILFVSIISVFFGIILTLCIQYYVFYVYLKKSPIASNVTHKKSYDYSLPNAIKKQLEAGDVSDKPKDGLAVNLVLQFLFHELRHSETIKRWLYKKLSMEFDELLTKTAMGKFFDSITIKDLHLGSQFPDIKDISIENVKLDPKNEHIEVLSLVLNLDYLGNFFMCIDAKMKFSKTAYLSIKVKKISGSARLQFSREPYTHWSFSFYNEPILDLAVESHFQGRQLQSNITNLIVHQIKKAIKRKHTLPNYKIRYKPFFVKTDPSQLDVEDTDLPVQGMLDMNISEISRLCYPEGANSIYLTMAVDSIPWISLYQKKDDTIIMTLEITMAKLKQTQLGVIFRQEPGAVVVDSVTNNSCAFHAGLKPSDVVISVENKSVTTVPQVAKYMKSVSGTHVTLRVERVVENYIIKWKGEEKDGGVQVAIEVKSDDSESELTQTEQESFVIVDSVKKEERKPRSPKIIPGNENMAKLAQTISNFSLRKRKGAGASPSTPQRARVSSSAKKNSATDLPEIVRTEADTLECEQIFSQVEVLRGKELQAASFLLFDDDFRFSIKDGSKYLNINAWATVTDSPDILLGYLNIPLSFIASECSVSVLGHHCRRYSFLPPGVSTTAHPLRLHSGFEQVFCFGDALLTFSWSSTFCEASEVPKKPPSEDFCAPVETKTDSIEVADKHDFVRTQFHGTTHCDFCSKKIWLKDAVQCRQCGMCCHKKCVAKCQTTGGTCSADKPPLLSVRMTDVSISDVILQPDGIEDMEPSSTVTETTLKRVNSVSNLSIPGSPSFASRSLPHSPQKTPSRKQSLVSTSPFSFCPTALEEVQRNPQEAAETVCRLLEQVMQCPPDESLMDNAKETGQRMYVGLTSDEKKDKINLMMAELKKTLDLSTSEHMELTKRLSTEESEVEKAKLAFLIGQADAKVHALSVLMLHYCSGLQYTQEKIV
ncbi:PDZ domain-containing protein 8 isoform X2 [Anthonomus grandis grandis]|uniref:PDZ domain-containing protein 8 isoform X2 n=1 Tax=Anthonomus grandis grandis TaxID=2921223 RepID=UPI0021658BD2|nr:PDZ domain-containing protein 8 isoform X2 [Anthonomus grandis grandis]